MPYLLIGGQACILYGAAEFSRDIDFTIATSPLSLEFWNKALGELRAKIIFFPPFEQKYLEKGHACHFRCHHPEAEGLRIDVIGRMRGCSDFSVLWNRCNLFNLPVLGDVNVISLSDLVSSKKTQRDKDWLMIRRLVEVDYITRIESATQEDIIWWLKECRTPEYLKEIAMKFHNLLPKIEERPWLKNIMECFEEKIEAYLEKEMKRIKEEDRKYWKPLIQELERMRILSRSGDQ